MWERLKTMCRHSLTIAWGYVLAIGGAILQTIDSAADALGSPDFKDQISSAIGDPKTVGRIMIAISIITIIARLRTAGKHSS